MANTEFQGFRISPQQRRLWSLQRVESSSPYYVRACVLLEGQVNARVLKEALYHVVMSHEVLRTTLRPMPGMEFPVQVIENEPSYTFTIHDVGIPEITIPEFDLSKGPLLKASLVTLSPGRQHQLHLCLPALCTDEAGLVLLVRDLAAAYAGLLGDEHVATETLQYADISEVLNDLLESEETGAGRSYWLQKEIAGPAEVKLPFADYPQNGHAFAPQSLNLTFDPDVTTSIAGLANANNVSTATFLQACWHLLLWKLTGEEEITVGTSFSGRVYEGLDAVPGLFARYLPISSRLREGQQINDVLDQIRNAVSAADEHQDYFDSERIVQRLSQRSDEPFFFPVSFEFVEPVPGFQAAGLTWTLQQQKSCTDRFALKLRCVASDGEGLRTEFHYAGERFAPRTIDLVARSYHTLVTDILQKTDVDQLTVMDDEQRRQLLVEFNDTAFTFDPPYCIHEAIEQQTARTPDNVAVIFAQQQLTYSELDARSNQLAHRLAQHGVGPETLVCVLVERSIEMIVGLIGVLKAGAAYLPLDPEQPAERLKRMIDDGEPVVLLTQERFLSIVNAVGVESLPVICLDKDWPDIATEPATRIDSGVGPANVAYVIYTSGSTGQPKGVAITHEAISNRLLWMQHRFPLSASDRVLQKTVYSFDASVWELFLPLMTGASVVMAAPGAQRDSAALVVAIKEESVTILQMVPSMLAVLVEEPGITECRSLRRVFSGGEPLTETLQERFYERVTWAELINLYGPTEASIDASYYRCERDRKRNKVLIGRPINNMQLYLLDEHQQPVPIGTPGELYIGGIGLARGYWKQAGLTAEYFGPNTFSTEAGTRLYRTGDVCRYLNDGTIEYLGRLDQQVKLRGFRIELGEIEAVLSQHPAVKRNVVIAREDVPGDKRLVAYIVLAETEAPGTADWRNYLKDKLPDYMIPVAFETLEAFPVTATGKLDVKRLPMPSHLMGAERNYVAPRTAVEETLANIWAEVLKLERVGIHDNFFELGGDSIRSIQVKAAAQKVGVDFSLEQLFAHQSVYALAEELKTSEPVAFEPPKTEPFSLVSSEDRARMPAGVEDAYPLTMLQSGMLFHREYSPDTAIYHDLAIFQMRGKVDMQALRVAMKQLVARHPILRTGLETTRFSEPLQLVYHTAGIPLEQIDLRSLSESEQEVVLKEWEETQKLRTFNLSQAPLMRFTVHRRSEDKIQFTMNCHHVILDGWSVAAMLAEFFRLYFVALGKAEPLPASPSSMFRDFVAREKMSLESEVCADYWTQKLSDYNVLKLPRRRELTDAMATAHPILHEVRMSEEVSNGLRALARTAGVPIRHVLLAAHLRVMSLVGGQTDVLTGVVTNCRLEETDGERSLGLFLNTVPWRQKLSGGSWIDLARETFATQRELLPHRWFPLAEIQRRLGGKHLFETAFNYIHFHVYESTAGFSEMQSLRADSFEQTNHTLTTTFSLEGQSRYVNLTLLCDAAQLDEEQVKEIAGYYVKTLELMANAPRERYERATLISDTEQQLLVEWNQTAGDYELGQCLHETIEAQVARTPEAVAVTCDGASLSYRQLNTRANQLAHHLTTIGVGPEVMVGVLMERSLEMMIGLLAILKAGGGYVPLDPEQPVDRLSMILNDATPPVLLTQERFQKRLERPGMKVVCLDGEWNTSNGNNIDNLDSGVGPANVAYVIYTSGSTGRPKGVAITHEAISNRLLWMQHRFPLSASDRVLQKTVYSFDASVWELFLPLMTGASVVMAAPGAQRDSAALVAAIKEESVTILQMVPSMLAVLVEEPGIADCRSLRRVFSGGEALTETLQERFYERVTWAELINLYGPTETSIDASYYPCERGRKRNKVLIGRPINNMQLYLLDEHQQPVPIGTPGELYVGGVGLARGYWRQPQLTADRFVPNVFSSEPGARLYRTGDLCRYSNDGAIEYLGRLDHQVKIRGFRIELGEIEAALLKQSGVRDVVVQARDDNGEGKRLVAYVVVSDSDDTGATPEKLQLALRKTLPDYMVPRAFITLDQLPLLPNGKVNLRALPEPDDASQFEIDNYVAPRTPVEDIVADIWANALRVEKISIHDNFFDLGGHSLLATQVISRIRQVFQIELPLRTLFDEATVAGFSRSIELARGGMLGALADRIERVSRESELPLSFSQQRLWFLDQLESGSAAYNVASAIRLEGNLDVDALRQSFDEILNRHEALRTTFTTVNGRPVQVIGPPQSVSLQIEDLQDLPDAERPSEMRRLIHEEVERPFDLGHGPLLRVMLLRLAETEYVALLTMHHIVSDGWSLGVLVREVSTLYQAFSRGEAPQLTELPVQYADYAAWQRQWLQGEVLEAQLDYWRRHLSAAPTVVELPVDQPRPMVQTYRGENYESKIDQTTAVALRELSRREAASLFMTLLAAFDVLVSRYTRQDHIVVGTDVANRNRQEIEGLIGYFANQLVLHADLSGNPTFRELLARVREITLGAYAHQDLPFERLVEELRPERDASRTPLFQLKVVMQNAPLPPMELPGLRLSAEEVGGGTAKFDLTIFMEDTPQGVNCTWQYNSDLFAPRTIERFATQFAQLLVQIARQPDAQLHDLIAVLDQRDREERLNEKQKVQAANFAKFKAAVKPQAVSVS